MQSVSREREDFLSLVNKEVCIDFLVYLLLNVYRFVELLLDEHSTGYFYNINSELYIIMTCFVELVFFLKHNCLIKFFNRADKMSE